jgi:hypothetical protein
MNCMAFSRDTSGGGRNQSVEMVRHDHERVQKEPSLTAIVEGGFVRAVRQWPAPEKDCAVARSQRRQDTFEFLAGRVAHRKHKRKARG